MPRVTFLIAGVQKGGTTALFEYLRENPAICLSREKELHFFDNEHSVNWLAPDYSLYHRSFDLNGQTCCGEATPIYLFWPRSLERIKRYNDRMKLVLLFRDPIERAWSHWRMEYARGAETMPFAWCIRDGRLRLPTDQPTADAHRVYSYVERGFYGEQLQRVYRLFAAEDVLLLRSDELRQFADETVRRVCRFVGVAEPTREVTKRVVHAAKEHDYGSMPTSADVDLLRRVFESDMELFKRQSRLDLSTWTTLQPRGAAVPLKNQSGSAPTR